MRQAGIFIESLMPAHDRSWTVFVGSGRAGWGGKFTTFPFPHLAVRYQTQAPSRGLLTWTTARNC